MKKTVVAGFGACAVALAFAAKDPVIMTVNGVDVPKSEFEYLYNKNSKQQINPQSLDEYVEMFKLYKMKVADARAEGLDTLDSFRKETEQYRHELAAPYLADSLYLNQLVNEAYDRSKEEVEAIHIMFFKGRDPLAIPAIRQRADSVHKLLENGADFAELAGRFSEDRGSKSKGGRMGYFTQGMLPISFELTAYSLPEGKISEVIETPVGYHILKGGKHRPARGKVQAAHILRMTRGLDDAAKAAVKKEVDSLYNVLAANPDKFTEIAVQKSDDRNSARQGGMLPWFGVGEMVEVFDSVAFALPDGAISKPVESAYGYHIIKKIGHRDIPSLAEVKPQILSRMTSPQDDRYKQIRARQTERFAKKHKGALNEKTIAAMRADVSKNGIDSLFVAEWTLTDKQKMPLFTVDGKATTAGELVGNISSIRQPVPEFGNLILTENIDALYNGKLVEAEEALLEKTEPDYRNLLKEYVDGSLLYEVSVRKVWDKAAKDTEGLEKYFLAHRDNYKWTEPHAKGYLVQTTNDSVASLIKARATELAPDTLMKTLRKEFPKQIAIDRVLVTKGTNAMVDNILFGGPVVKPSSSTYQVYFMLDPVVITEPQEVGDVRGLVTSDYQNEFQAAWENELRKKYPAVVNDKVLKTVKKNQ